MHAAIFVVVSNWVPRSGDFRMLRVADDPEIDRYLAGVVEI